LQVLAGLPPGGPKPAKKDKAAAAPDAAPEEIKFAVGALSDQFGVLLVAKAREAVMGTTGEFILADVEVPNPDAKDGQPKTVKKTIKLPQFSETLENRLVAAGMTDGRSEDVIWVAGERAALGDDFAKMASDAFGGIDLDKVKIGTLPKEVARWVAENQKVLEALQ
jgi:hypothetical protein